MVEDRTHNLVEALVVATMLLVALLEAANLHTLLEVACHFVVVQGQIADHFEDFQAWVDSEQTLEVGSCCLIQMESILQLAK